MPPPPLPFPPPEEDGLVLLGGELTCEWLLAAYRQGVFPWPIVTAGWEQLAWFSPHERAILPFSSLHLSRRTKRRMRRGEFSYSIDAAFRQVLEGCSLRASHEGVWLTHSLAVAYEAMHAIGHAHSIEVWKGEALAAGILGVTVDGLFSAESMFHRERDAGNACLGYLVQQLAACGYTLLDIQQMSPHMARRGAIEITANEYRSRLAKALEVKPRPFS